MKGSDFVPIFISTNVFKHTGIFGVVTSPQWDGETRNDSEKGTGSQLRHGSSYGGKRFFLLDLQARKLKPEKKYDRNLYKTWIGKDELKKKNRKRAYLLTTLLQGTNLTFFLKLA